MCQFKQRIQSSVLSNIDINIEYMGGEIYGRTDANFCWMHSSLLASVDVTEFQTTRACADFDPYSMKRNRHIETERWKSEVCEASKAQYLDAFGKDKFKPKLRTLRI
jgi:hypothetical protein